MHCASCEILIEKTIIDLPGVQAVDASTPKGQVMVEYDEGKKPDVRKLNKIFKNDHYFFKEIVNNHELITNNHFLWKDCLWVLVVMAIFLGLNQLGFANLVNISAKSSLPVFFLFGLVAGFSTCAALVGGIVLSMAKQWGELYKGNKLAPHLLFNAGRMVSFGLLGGVLGAIGGQIQLSFGFTSFLVMVVSAIMIILGLQM